MNGMKYTKSYLDDVRLAINAVPDITALFNKKILITGSTGMICSAVVEMLLLLNKECSADIRLILAGRNKARIDARFEGIMSESDYEFVEYDMTSGKAIAADVDYIIHGAGNADPARISEMPVETMLGNTNGLRTLLELARNNNGCRLLFLSSGEIYGNRIGNEENASKGFSEDEYGFIDQLNPRSSYPMSKRAAETLCASYYKEYCTDFVVARSCHVYGPSITDADSRATASFSRDAVSGRNIVMKSAGDQIRSYCYTLDCASALLTIMICGDTGNAYNISNKDSIVSIREIAEAMAAEGGVRVVFENPSDAEKKSYNLMKCSALNSDKLEALGWKAAFDLKKGVKATLKYLNN